MNNNYIVIGDSITYGIGDFENGGWASLLKKYYVIYIMTRYELIQQRKNDVGKIIRLIDIAEKDHDPIAAKLIGKTGTIIGVDDEGSYHVKWNGSSSSIAVLIEDTVEFLDGDEPNDERYNKYLESRKDLRKSGKNSINESFDDSNLSELIANHRGLKKYNVKYDDARYNELSYDLKKAVAVGYIPKDIVEEYLNMFSTVLPLNQQMLVCNDGGVIVIEQPNIFKTDYPDKEYEQKVRSRNDNFRNDHGVEKYPYIGVDTDTIRYRRLKHRNLLNDKNLYFRN